MVIAPPTRSAQAVLQSSGPEDLFGAPGGDVGGTWTEILFGPKNAENVNEQKWEI